jgi:hypothetical protein
MYRIVYLGLTYHVAMYYDAIRNLAVNNVMDAGILKLMPYANFKLQITQRDRVSGVASISIRLLFACDVFLTDFACNGEVCYVCLY